MGKVIDFPFGPKPSGVRTPPIPPVPAVPAVPGVPASPAAPELQGEERERSLSRRGAGQIAKKRGGQCERFLMDRILQPAVEHGLFLRIDRQHPDMVPTHLQDGKFRPLFRLGAESGCDWIALCGKRLPFAYLPIEAKSTSGEALAFSSMREDQVLHLNAAVDADQEGLLIVEFSHPVPEFYGVRWSTAPWARVGKGHSLARSALREDQRLRNWTCLERILGATS